MFLIFNITNSSVLNFSVFDDKHQFLSDELILKCKLPLLFIWYSFTEILHFGHFIIFKLLFVLSDPLLGALLGFGLVLFSEDSELVDAFLPSFTVLLACLQVLFLS